MDQLLINISAHLKTEVPALKKKHAYIVPDENLLPETAPFPCVALKDNGTVTETYGSAKDQTLKVLIIVYVKISKQYDSGIIGHDNRKGILEMTTLIRDALLRYNPPGYCFLDWGEETSNEGAFEQDPDVNRIKLEAEWIKNRA